MRTETEDKIFDILRKNRVVMWEVSSLLEYDLKGKVVRPLVIKVHGSIPEKDSLEIKKIVEREYHYIRDCATIKTRIKGSRGFKVFGPGDKIYNEYPAPEWADR